jgi:hypothetical protein
MIRAIDALCKLRAHINFSFTMSVYLLLMDKKRTTQSHMSSGKHDFLSVHRELDSGQRLFIAQQSPAAQHMTSENLHIFCTFFG